MKRVNVYKNLSSIYLDGEDVQSVFAMIQEIKERHPEYDRYVFSVEPDPYCEGSTMYIQGIRLENDDEYEIRMNHYNNSEKKKEESERQEYERLKKKFEGS